MIRKLTLGLLAAASLGATALIPSAASAHGFHGWGWHGGFGHHGFYGGGPTFVVGGGGYYDDCLQRRVVETRRGPRVRLVNVCAY
jgi:hypothetical protein